MNSVVITIEPLIISTHTHTSAMQDTLHEYFHKLDRIKNRLSNGNILRARERVE